MRKRSFLFANLTVMLLMMSGVSHSQEDDPIDHGLNECMKHNVTTVEQLMCIDDARILWEVELNRVYSQLMSNLGENGSDALQRSQEAWLSFREKELETIEGIYANFDGTLYSLLKALDVMNLTKDRVRELRSYESLFEIE